MADRKSRASSAGSGGAAPHPSIAEPGAGKRRRKKTADVIDVGEAPRDRAS
jgi:hypothetical protein